MKQYFISFLTAFFLIINIYFYYYSSALFKNNSLNNELILESEFGKTIITGGQITLFNQENLIIATLGSNNRKSGEFSIYNHNGYNIINLGAHYGDGMNGNGVFNINDQSGEYGWSVIGKVRDAHYQ